MHGGEAVGNAKGEYDKIILKGMKFFGKHGLCPEEKERGQWFEVDVEIWGNYASALERDDLQGSVDYRDIYDIVKKVLEHTRVNLLEHLAARITEGIMGFPQIEKTLVRIKKPQVELGGQLSYSGFEMMRIKNG